MGPAGGGFFVPEKARWRFIKDASRSKGVADTLNKALSELELANTPALDDVVSGGSEARNLKTSNPVARLRKDRPVAPVWGSQVEDRVERDEARFH